MEESADEDEEEEDTAERNMAECGQAEERLKDCVRFSPVEQEHTPFWGGVVLEVVHHTT